MSISKTSENHLEQSHKEFKCSYCDATFNTTTLLHEHVKNVCPLVTVNCVLKQYGCEAQILRQDLQKHYMTKEHQRNLLLAAPLNSCHANEISQASLTDDMEIDASDGTTTDTTTNPLSSATKQRNGALDVIEEALNVVSCGIEALNHDIQHLQNASVKQLEQVKNIELSQEILQVSSEESNAQLLGELINLNILQEQCVFLAEKIEQHQYTSYDGTFLWRISKVEEKINDARSERQVSIYSPPFYSSPSGYKMCARLYFQGDGNARHNYMSLFFVLMRGPNDPLLAFPFKYKVMFCLYDQSDAEKHIVDAFRPDTRSNSFQRPCSDMNIASGIPKFASLAVIQQPNSPYIKDDTMFIKIMVDFENLPKTVLPFVTSLNPGLPTGLQQCMIQAEIQKQAQINVANNDNKTTK